MTAPIRAWLRADLLTYVIVTAVSALVWYWAAGETRESRSLPGVIVKFTVPSAASWRLSPTATPVTITVEGSRRAINRAAAIDRLTVERPAAVGEQVVDMLDALESNPEVIEAGISIVSVSPSSVTLSMDAIVQQPARVRPVLPGVQSDGEIVVTPAQVTLSLPGQLRPFVSEDATVEAFVDRQQLDRLEPGVPHTLENVVLRLPEPLSDRPIAITPSAVRMTFTIRSQIRELPLVTPVRVQTAGPPEDTEYLIAFEPKQLRDVIVSAPVTVIDKIESGDAVVIAIVHLKSTEKEARLDRKRVASFVALMPDGSFVAVDARVGETGESRPEIGVTITAQGE